MGYFDYLKELLRPLRLYDLEEGFGAAELFAEGAGFDALFTALLDAEREAIPASAESFGLSCYEAILPYAPASPDAESRRQALMALLRIDGRSFTPAALNDTLAGCGIPALAEETETPQTLRVSFPGTRGRPADYAALQERIAQILPCHLALLYYIDYSTWAEIEAAFRTWSALEAANLTWQTLENKNWP